MTKDWDKNEDRKERKESISGWKFREGFLEKVIMDMSVITMEIQVEMYNRRKGIPGRCRSVNLKKC